MTDTPDILQQEVRKPKDRIRLDLTPIEAKVLMKLIASKRALSDDELGVQRLLAEGITNYFINN